ncbi:asparagine synthase (glutamine-hydrolyzing) [Zavarzinella formosa]|uniref:asparagine synthase (glutamine-hydrolyzing) n=1 Tax=Zavarzinella formosa TaxID=360055 RepID=UPI0002E58EBD|nr:asparagine synthase (glutamine-hydrolyzing) [Zavarzinella formosa]
MCGIAGIINNAGQPPVSSSMLRRMAGAMIHRGPDDDGFLERNSLGLANRRLSIVGLSDGKQPISNEDGSLWVVFNGELYDYPKIRADLERRGHRFKTSTDTELIPHLFEEYGERFFEHLRGQFAFCLWSVRDDRLILARDRFGICPLFWSVQRQQGRETLLFGSEVKSILASGLVPRKTDLNGINQIFSFFALPGPMTCFEGISQVSPGHYLDIRRDSSASELSIRDRIYWEIDFPDQGEELNPPDKLAIEHYEHLFVQSVKRRLQADVPVVSYLSGGVDSSLVTAVASKLLGRPIPTFTVGVRTTGFDETNLAQEFSKHLGSTTTVCEYNPEDACADYPKLISAAEFPVVDSSSASLQRLAGFVRNAGFKVAMTGEGSDEFLAGYPWFKVNQILRCLEVLPGVRVGNLLRVGLLKLTKQPAFPMRMLNAAQDAVGGSNGWLEVYGMMSLSKVRFFHPDLKGKLFGQTPYAALNLNTERLKRWHPFHRGLYLGGRIMLPGHLLASKGDRVAMWSSVETRPPFLDEDLVAFTNSLHPRWKLRRLKDKYLLRKVARRWMPRETADRSKKMFRAPLDSFHMSDPKLPKWIGQVLSEESLRKTGYFDPKAVIEWRKRLPSMRKSLSKTSVEMGLIAVMSTQLWHHLFVSGDLAEIPSLIPGGDILGESLMARAG